MSIQHDCIAISLFGAVEGVWLSLRTYKTKSLSALLIEAVGAPTVLTLASALIYKAQEQTSGCKPGEFGCGAQFWWFAWGVLALLAVLSAYVLRSSILVPPKSLSR